MRFEDIKLTRNNYTSVLEGYSAEILEIVELCIKDDTDVGNFIARCKNDPYRLWEVRWCIKENIPATLYGKVRYARVLSELRKYKQDGYNLSNLNNKLTITQSEQAMLMIIELSKKNIDVSGYDFNCVTDACLPILQKEIEAGMDLTGFINQYGAQNAEYLTKIISIMKLNKDLTPYTTYNWSIPALDVVTTNLLYGDDKIYNSIIPYINPETMNPYYIEEAINLCKQGLDPKNIFSLKLSEILTKRDALLMGVSKNVVADQDISEDGLRLKTKLKRSKNITRRTL